MTTAIEREYVYLILRARRDDNDDRADQLRERALLYGIEHIDLLVEDADALPTELTIVSSRAKMGRSRRSA